MARDVPLRYMAMAIAANAGTPLPFEPPKLKPNQMQLYSYYRPGLQAGNYSIDVKQEIGSQSNELKDPKKPKGDREWRHSTLTIQNTTKSPDGQPAPQLFEVVQPQFSMERAIVNSYYPPDGHQDEARILPHIVLNDEHFPWERRAGFLIQDVCDPDLQSDRSTKVEDGSLRSAVPWVAVMVFDPSELSLPQDFKPPLDSKLDPKPQPVDLKLDKQALNGAFPMRVQDYMNFDLTARVHYDAHSLDALQKSEAMTAIFPTRATFLKMFPSVIDVENQKYLAHMRAVST